MPDPDDILHRKRVRREEGNVHSRLGSADDSDHGRNPPSQSAGET